MKGDEEETVLRKTLASLDAQRKALEHEADAILLELTTPPEEGVEPMGLDTPLVDFDGYPRNDIDVYRARSQRNRFNVIKTDHKELERKIEALLLQLASMKVRKMFTDFNPIALYWGVFESCSPHHCEPSTSNFCSIRPRPKKKKSSTSRRAAWLPSQSQSSTLLPGSGSS